MVWRLRRLCVRFRGIAWAVLFLQLPRGCHGGVSRQQLRAGGWTIYIRLPDLLRLHREHRLESRTIGEALAERMIAPQPPARLYAEGHQCVPPQMIIPRRYFPIQGVTQGEPVVLFMKFTSRL